MNSNMLNRAATEPVELPLDEAATGCGCAWSTWVERVGLNISHLPAWVRCAAAAHGRMDEVRVLVRQRGDGGVSVVPYRFVRRTMAGIPYRALLVGAGLVGYHHDWLAGEAGHDRLRALFSVAERCGAHAVVAENVKAPSQTHRILNEGLQERLLWVLERPGEASPILRIEGTWEEYLRSKRKSFRYEARRRVRRLSEAGSWRVVRSPADMDVARLLEVMLEIEGESWKHRTGIAIEPGSREHRYYELLLPTLQDMDALYAVVLEVESEPVAYNLMYRWKGTLGSMKTSYKERWKTWSPGAVLQGLVIEEAFRDGVQVYDFLGDRAFHKEQWANGEIAHCTWIGFLRTARGQVARLAHRARAALRAVEPAVGAG